jgi:nicotinate-nucleotide adenylyltransferase
MRVAFFGGSFDPPHLGHIAVARAAQQALALDRVLFAPVGLQPLKPAGSSASFEDRLAMTRLAIAGEPQFELSLADAPSSRGLTPNYTVDTLTHLRAHFPPDAQWFLLLGADSFRTFHHWRRAAEIPFLASLIVASRPGESLDDLPRLMPPGIALNPVPSQPHQYLLRDPSGRQSQLTLLPDLHYDISATQLRQQINGLPGDQPTPLFPAVLQYIREHKLYSGPRAFET